MSGYDVYVERCAAEGLTPYPERVYRLIAAPLSWSSMWRACRFMGEPDVATTRWLAALCAEVTDHDSSWRPVLRAAS